MDTEVSYSSARANFARLCDQVVDDRDIVYIHRRGRGDVALIAADELHALFRTIQRALWEEPTTPEHDDV
ncbi:MAG: type II toxin-antitoxin system Phd/YefM family antitoxin [Chloroflexi bacterium]|nr:type II toxin-antitoxin system Phd/YefM family antitoxin [Chloroflexota bacterium]